MDKLKALQSIKGSAMQQKPSKEKEVPFKRVLVAAIFAAVLHTPNAQAACTSPAGDQGDIVFNTSVATMQFCDGSTWWDMKSSEVLSRLSCSNGQVPTWSAATSEWICGEAGSRNASDLTSGIVPVARGGTGLSTTPSNGQILIGDGTGFSLGTITVGSGLSINNNAGAIEIALTSTTIAGSGSLVTYDQQGRITGSNNLSLELTGDVTASSATLSSASTTLTTSLAATGVTPGVYGSASSVPSFTVDAKGRITSAANIAIALNASAITSGVLPVTVGGTGASTFTSGGVLLGAGTGAVTTVVGSSNGHVLTWDATLGRWKSAAGFGASGPSVASVSGTSIDFSVAPVVYTSASCGTFTLSNLQDGGYYTLIVKGTTAGICTFTSAGLVFRPASVASPAAGNVSQGFMAAAAKQLVFTFIRAGSDIYSSWVSDF